MERLALSCVLVRKYKYILGPAFGITLLCFAAWVLFDKFKELSIDELIAGFQNVHFSQVVLCIVLTVAYYVILSGYDALAFRVIGHPLPYRRIALGSFIGYAFSHNIGFSVLSSGSIRYRIYSSFGLTTAEIGKIVFFTSLTVGVGYATVSGVMFAFFPIPMRHTLLHFESMRPIGIILLSFLFCYTLISTSITDGKRIWKFRIPQLKLRMLIRQILLGSCEWILGAMVVYSVMPFSTPLSSLFVLEVFLLAQVAGIVSQVPGGIGVFESVLLLLLPAKFPTSHMLAALIVYRAIFYVLPLIVATIALATHEFRGTKHHFTNR